MGNQPPPPTTPPPLQLPSLRPQVDVSLAREQQLRRAHTMASTARPRGSSRLVTLVSTQFLVPA